MWIIFVIYVSCLSCCLVCSLQPCGHLMGKDWPLGSLVCDVFLCFVTFPCGVQDQVWYMIVSIPDLCLLLTFTSGPSMNLRPGPPSCRYSYNRIKE